MAITPSWPGVHLLATTTDARKAIAGLLVRNTSGVARSGILPAHTNALITARSDMNIDVQVFQAAGVQFGGPVLFSNDAVAQLPSNLVSPVSGTNYYVVYAKQNESTSPGVDPNTNRVLGTVLSTTSLATARASGARMDASGTGLPTGAVEVGTVELPTGKTATNQSGVIITATHQFTTTEGGILLLRNQTEEDAWAPHDGSPAYRIDLARPLVRMAGQWRTAVDFAHSQQFLNSAGNIAGGVTLGSTVPITAAPYARRFRIRLDGFASPSSAGTAGVQVSSTNGTLTPPDTEASTNMRIRTEVGAQFYAYGRTVFLDLPASTSTTITYRSVSSVTANYQVTAEVIQLAAGSY